MRVAPVDRVATSRDVALQAILLPRIVAAADAD
jgi:hypothetical protein